MKKLTARETMSIINSLIYKLNDTTEQVEKAMAHFGREMAGDEKELIEFYNKLIYKLENSYEILLDFDPFVEVPYTNINETIKEAMM